MATETSVMAVIRASRPSFRSSHDKAAFALHAAFLAAGYALTATGRAALAGSPPEGAIPHLDAVFFVCRRSRGAYADLRGGNSRR